MVTLPEFIRPGGLVLVNGWCGVVADVAAGAEHVMVYVESPKMIARGGRAEWLDYTLNPGAWQAATPDDLRREINDYREWVRQRLAELDEMEKRSR